MVGTIVAVVGVDKMNAMRVEDRGTTRPAIARNGEVFLPGEKVRIVQVSGMRLVIEANK